jgi:PAS domain S-box-containing protein
MTPQILPDPVGNRFELLVQSITDYAIYLLDPQGIISSWNAGAQRFKGYLAEEIIGEHFSRLYTDEDRASGLPARALRTAEQEGRFEAEGWRVRQDGTRFWANVVIDPVRDPAGKLIGFAKITRDLTERHTSDEALRQSEQRFRLLVESVTDYAIYMIDRTGIVSSWNAGAQRAKGYKADEIIGQHFSRFYTEEDRAAGLPQKALHTAEVEGRFEAEGWRCRQDGTRFWASVVIDPVWHPTGGLIGFAKVTRDLSERRKAQEVLFQSQKMDAIGKLTGGVAHDFNNLLAAIIGSLELIKRRLPPDHDTARFVDNAMQAAKRGVSLTQRMLAFARKQELQLTTVDLAQLVRGMGELLQRTIDAGIAIETRFPLVLQDVRSDPAQLELAILNLVVNARDAMPDGGRIVIGAEYERRTIDRSGELPAGVYIRLSVSDTGEGMEKEVLARATEPFYTTKGVGKGTGLGLSMVHGLAEQCGGKLELESCKGEGTTATLWLPVAQAAERKAEQPAAKQELVMAACSLLVLAVDDDPLVLNNTVAQLEDLGHRVLHALSGKQALEILAAQPVEMLITDYAMPKMTGIQLAEAAQAGWPDLPVLLVSGYAELEQQHPARFRKLSKPFGAMELGRAIEEASGHQQSGAVVDFRRPRQRQPE